MAEGGGRSDGKRRRVGLWEEMAEKKTVDATPLPTRDSNPAAAAASAAVETSSICVFDCRCASIRSGITLFPRRFHHSLVPSVLPRPMNPPPPRSPRADAKHVREPGSRTSDRERRQGKSGPGLVQSGSRTIPTPCPALPCPQPRHFFSSLLVLGAEPIGKISRTSIPRDLSPTEDQSRSRGRTVSALASHDDDGGDEGPVPMSSSSTSSLSRQATVSPKAR